MLRLINQSAKFPPLYEHVERRDPTIKDKGWDKVGDFLLRDKKDFMPQKGLQEKLCACDSNLIFICGAATLGKTYGMMLKALRGVNKPGFSGRFISVRLQDSRKGGSIYRDGVEVWGNFAKCEYTSSEYPTFSWRQWNSAIQMIHSNFNVDNPDEWADFKEYAKKNQASYIAIDEATDVRAFKMFTYWFSRNRDSSGMTPCMVLSFNPEHTHWTTEMLLDAGYIGDDYYIKPEMDGVQRFFYIDGDEPKDIVWGDSREEVVQRANITISEKDAAAGLKPEDMVKTFTMFTGEAADNLKLIAATGGGSVANLHAVGKTQRSILKGAYFGPVDNEELRVTRQMMRDIQNNPINDDDQMYATMDVSGGNTESDNCPMIIWRGLRIVAIELFRGDPKQLVDWINLILARYNVPVENFAFDATGIGNYLRAFTSGWPVTANKAAMQEYDAIGNPITLEQYFNLRSQLLGKMKVLFETGQISSGVDLNSRIPYGKKGEKRKIIEILYDEINIFVSTTRNKRIYYRSKDEYKARFKSSPDLMDAICLRAVWELDARPRKKASPEINDDAYYGLNKRYSGRVVWV